MASAVLRSAIFQGVLGASALFVALAMAVLWAAGLALIWDIDATLEAELTAEIEEAREFYLIEGRDAAIGALLWDGERAIWTDDNIWELLEGEEQLAVLRDPEGEPIAGYPELFAGDVVGLGELFHSEIDVPVIAVSTGLFDGASVTLGRFVPEQRDEIWAFLITASWALLIIVLPLALLTGFLLSRRVFRRLDALAATTEAVGSGDLSARAELTGAGDEFDRLGAGVNRMLDKLEDMTRNIQAVSVGVAHDLKTPLASIQGRLELIRRDAGDADAVVAHLDQAEERLSGLLRVFDALLRLGEIEAGKRRQAFSEVDLSAIAASLAEGFEPAFGDAEKTLDTAILPRLKVTGDADLLAQMIANLFDNALEHARDGARVHIALTASEGVRLEIGDDGPGIAPAMRERVFERFYRGDASRGSAGHGLGLALVKAIADLHGAQTELLDDRPGTVFVFTFPKAD